MSITLGGVLITALIVSVIVIGMKVKRNTEKLQELDEIANTEE
jgi:hypothetical protein